MNVFHFLYFKKPHCLCLFVWKGEAKFEPFTGAGQRAGGAFSLLQNNKSIKASLLKNPRESELVSVFELLLVDSLNNCF